MEHHEPEKSAVAQPLPDGNDTPSPSNEVESQQQKETRKLTGWKWFMFNVTTLTAIFLYALDNTIVANIQPIMVNDFQAVDELPWLAVGFMIGGLAMVMPLGKLYGRFDNKWLFIFFAVNFMAASALCGGAPNMDAEIIGRVWAGAGGNGMYYGLLNLVTANTLDRERSTYLSLTGMVWGFGTILGPVIGGAFSLASWRWAFYLNLFFAIPLLPSYLYLIPSNEPAPHLSFKTKLATIDWVGALLSTASIVTILVATNFGGVLYEWNSGAIIALYVVSGVCFLLFVAQQTLAFLTTLEDRMLPVHLLPNKEVILLFILAACGGTVTYVSVYYVPLYFQFTRGDDAIQTSERILPLVFLLIFGMLTNGYLMSKLGYYKPWYVFGTALSIVGGVLWSRVELETSNAAVYGYQVLIGLGAGCFTHASFAVVQANVDPKDSVNALTLMTLGQLSGLAFSLSITGAVFINRAIDNLRAVFPNMDEGELESIVSGTSGGLLERIGEQQRNNALNAILDAMHQPFVHIYIAAAVAFVLSCLLKWKKVYTVAAGGA
ncbi:major facilitator superfamily domain-containing protein [Stachybotrys elegans]|uniref:Major facilitator superfamily domain-containing protein n=1 Tax=Stachybotrys elegans TaxID=80388 RepID=A0A8K0SF22_9HYPO|nr:major facilitator superfamily domain-containing protein [Stachybotrys elegans]